mgnify:CR=1 FL=1
MEYQSTREAAEHWGVSLRYVQRLLKENRIPDARKFSGAWLLPADAEKPYDLRKQSRPEKKSRWLLATSTALPKGRPDAALENVPPAYHALAVADLEFRRGNTAPILTLWRQSELTDENRLSYASLAIAAAISAGDYSLYYEIESYLRRCSIGASKCEQALLSLPAVLAAVSMALPDMTPQWLKQADFSQFPQEISVFLLYLYTLHLRNIGDWKAVFSTARAALILCAQTNTFTWMDVYFGVLAANACLALGDTQTAKQHLYSALELAIPYGFLAPFADHLGELEGMPEEYLRQRNASLVKPLSELWNNSFKNWVRFHNEFARQNVTTILTPQEYQIARLLVSGASYAGAARRMSLSVGRTKNIIAEIYGKLCIQKRSELTKYLL